jgi:hypothetical protein
MLKLVSLRILNSIQVQRVPFYFATQNVSIAILYRIEREVVFLHLLALKFVVRIMKFPSRTLCVGEQKKLKLSNGVACILCLLWRYL